MGNPDGHAIAITGLACRFPGSPSPDDYWRNLIGGVDCITTHSREALLLSGVPEADADHPTFIAADGYLADADCFDAEFFGFSDIEAQLTDPQHRLFLEIAWSALESSGIDPLTAPDRIGCFAGSGMSLYAGRQMSSYASRNLLANRGLLEQVPAPATVVGNYPDYLCTRVAYKLNLRGPAVTVQTACSTSLVAVHMAKASLLSGDCDIAIAGAAAVHVPLRSGFRDEGGMLSPDGRCKAFDSGASGAIGGSGVGAVIMMPTHKAIEEGYPVRAVLRGSAINNDGSRKVSYLAPSIQGQVDCIHAALADAGVPAHSVTHVEAHGTGTPLGDACEVAALREAYGGPAGGSAPCALGSAKTVVGHLDTAAGMAGLIKAILSLEHRVIPPVVHFREANSDLELDGTRFYVPKQAERWVGHERHPLRVAVSSFGAGGTNAHLVLEAPQPQVPTVGEAPGENHIIVLSARSEAALRDLASAHAEHLAQMDQAQLPDMAYTTQTGRHHLEQRLATVASDPSHAARAIGSWAAGERADAGQVYRGGGEPRPIVFLYPGQGSLSVAAHRHLWEDEPNYREAVAACIEAFRNCGSEVPDQLALAGEHTRQAAFVQPFLFSVGYGLTALWRSRGVRPDLVIGHSLGEFAAACAAGAIDLPAAAALINSRGTLMDQLCPNGAMLAAFCDAGTAEAALAQAGAQGQACVAVYNAERSVVLSGEAAAVARVGALLAEERVHCVRIDATHPFHSPVIDPMVAPFRSRTRDVAIAEPSIRWISTRSGELVISAPDASYWSGQVRSPVQFKAAAAKAAAALPGCRFVEVGIGNTLSRIVRMDQPAALTVPSVLPRDVGRSLAHATSSLFADGRNIRWRALHQDGRRLLPLPTYPFRRKRAWIDPPRGARNGASAVLARTSEIDHRGEEDVIIGAVRWEPVPESARLQAGLRLQESDWVLASAFESGSSAIARAIADGGGRCQTIRGVDSPDGWLRAIRAVTSSTSARRGIICHCPDMTGHDRLDLERASWPALAAVMDLLAAVGRTDEAVEVVVTTSGAQAVNGRVAAPRGAAAWGYLRAARIEFPHLRLALVDLDPDAPGQWGRQVCGSLTSSPVETGWRAGVLRQPTVVRVPGHATAGGPPGLDPDGLYVLTGGTGALGRQVAKTLISCGARALLLVSRSAGNAESQRALESLRQTGSEILALDADVRSPAGIDRIRRAVAAAGRRLAGMIHLAGVLDDAVVAHQSWQRVANVMAPKAIGLLGLQLLAREAGSDFVLAFSSLAGLCGSPGQANYAAANAVVEAVCSQQDTKDVPTGVISWGPWRDGNMIAGNLGGRSPLSPISSASALSILRQMLSGSLPRQVFAAGIRPGTSVLDGNGIPLVQMAKRVWPGGDRNGRRSAGEQARPVAKDARDIGKHLMNVVRTMIEVDVEFDATSPFADIGVDSLRGLQLRDAVLERYGILYSATLIYDYPSISALAGEIESRLLRSGATRADPGDLERALYEEITRPIEPSWRRQNTEPTSTTAR